LRGAKGSRFRPVTGISLKGSVFEIEALQRREVFTQFLDALALFCFMCFYRIPPENWAGAVKKMKRGLASPVESGNLKPV
jgi:hypothetical protein